MEEYFKPDMELHLYKARIYDVGKNGDDRLQVRIIPNMVDYDSSELEYLPKFPCLFKGQVINGYTEVSDPDLAENVLVMSNDDFNYGWVICKLNQFYTPAQGAFSDSYNFSYFQNYISSRGLDVSNVNYDDIVVKDWVSGDEGGFINAYNYRTGEYYIINSSGTCIVMQQGTIYIRVGSPNGTSTGGNDNPFSTIEMTPTKISVKTKTFEVDADDVVLGHHSMNVLGTLAVDPVALTGVNLQPISNIHV